MNELRELISKYLLREIGYEAFRREMVIRFQSKKLSDPDLQKVVDMISDSFADFSEASISEPVFMSRLSAFLPSVNVVPLAAAAPNSPEQETRYEISVAAPQISRSNLSYFSNPQIAVSGLSPFSIGAFSSPSGSETWSQFGGIQIAAQFASPLQPQSSHLSNKDLLLTP